MIEPSINWEPYTSILMVLPWTTETVAMLEITGTGFVTSNGLELKTPPVGMGLLTVILNVPVAAKSEEINSMVNCSPVINNVVRFDPLIRPMDWPLIKLVPFTVNVKPGLPRAPDVGEILVIVGGFVLGVTEKP